MDTIQQCEAEVWNGWNKYRCSKNAKVERNGKHYCTIHDPERARKKAELERIKDEKRRESNDYLYASERYCKKKGLTIEQLKDAISGDDLKSEKGDVQ